MSESGSPSLFHVKKIGSKVTIRLGAGCLFIAIKRNADVLTKRLFEVAVVLGTFAGASLMGWAIVRNVPEIMREIRLFDFTDGYAAMAAVFSLTIIAVVAHCAWIITLRETIDIQHGVLIHSRKALWTLDTKSYEIVFIKHLRIAIPEGKSEIPIRGTFARINAMDGRILDKGTIVFNYQGQNVDIAGGIDRLTATYLLQSLNSYGIQFGG